MRLVFHGLLITSYSVVIDETRQKHTSKTAFKTALNKGQGEVSNHADAHANLGKAILKKGGYAEGATAFKKTSLLVQPVQKRNAIFSVHSER